MKKLSEMEFETAIAKFKEFKETIFRFESKEECVAYPQNAGN